MSFSRQRTLLRSATPPTCAENRGVTSSATQQVPAAAQRLTATEIAGGPVATRALILTTRPTPLALFSDMYPEDVATPVSIRYVDLTEKGDAVVAAGCPIPATPAIKRWIRR